MVTTTPRTTLTRKYDCGAVVRLTLKGTADDPVGLRVLAADGGKLSIQGGGFPPGVKTSYTLDGPAALYWLTELGG